MALQFQAIPSATPFCRLLVELATRDTIEKGFSNAALASDDEKAEIPLKLVVFTAPGFSSSEKAGDWVATGKTSDGTFSRRNHNSAELNDVLCSGAEFTLRIIAFENRFEVRAKLCLYSYEYFASFSNETRLILCNRFTWRTFWWCLSST